MTKQLLFLLITLSLVITPHTINSQTSCVGNDSFYHVKTDGGISQNSITSIAQDSIGQIWIATKNGLIRYNGRNYFIYKNEPHNPNSIKHNFIHTTYVTKEGVLWLGSQHGIYKYRSETDDFESIHSKETDNLFVHSIIQDRSKTLWFTDNNSSSLFYYKPDTNELASFVYKDTLNNIKDIRFYQVVITQNNKLWISTNKHFVLVFDPVNKSFKQIDFLDKSTLKKYAYFRSLGQAMSIDSKGNILIGTYFGYIVKINPISNKKSKIIYKTKFTDKRFSKNKAVGIQFVFEDKEKNIWVGSWFDGLYKILPNQSEIIHFLPKPNDDTTISNDIITSVLQDKAGYMWFGSEFAGINILKKNKKFNVLANDSNNKNCLPPFPYLSVAVDNNERTWIGTDGGNLCYYDKNTSNIYKIDKPELGNVKRIFKLLYDKKGNLWIGTGNGLFKYHLKTKSTEHFTHKTDNYNSLSGKNIISICEDQDGNIWTGSIHRGVTKFDISNNKFYRFLHDNNNHNSLSNNYISTIFCDTNNTIWIGTADGLNKFNPLAGNFTVFRYDSKNINSISNSFINCIYENENELWIGTEGGGLNLYKQNKFTTYLKKDGLISNNVRGINSDNKNNLWISTTHSISKFDLNSKQFINYTKSDGLQNRMYISNYGNQDLEFFENFSYRDKKGYLYFGGIGGMCVFHPDSLPQNSYKPPIIIDDFFVNGKRINYKTNKSILLKPDQNHIEISLTVLNYIQPDKNQYAYYLENYDKEWIYSGQNYNVEYFSIPSGKYQFYYKGANNDGVWNNNLTPISIIIKPHFYETSLFYFMIVLIILILLISFLMYKGYIKKQIKSEKISLRYSASLLSKEEAHRINTQLEDLLTSEPLYFETDLTLYKLADTLKVKPHDLSQVINQFHNKHFQDFINHYRILEAQKLLTTTKLKIESIAFDSGFNALSTFYTAFKKEMGMTPKTYRKKHSDL
jgi:ligand-binding sensor domain-containing protein/AraC-like DNA-binding protein